MRTWSSVNYDQALPVIRLSKMGEFGNKTTTTKILIATEGINKDAHRLINCAYILVWLVQLP